MWQSENIKNKLGVIYQSRGLWRRIRGMLFPNGPVQHLSKLNDFSAMISLELSCMLACIIRLDLNLFNETASAF